MTLQEIAYLILEPIRSFRITDDEEIDIRLVKAWIKIKRAEILKNKANQGQDINLNNAQSMSVNLQSVPTYTGIPSSTNYICGSTQDYTIYKSQYALPSILAGHYGPIVLELTSEDRMQYPFSFVPYSQLRFSGNGRFTKNLLYGAIDVDKHLYIKTNPELVLRPSAIIKAVFEDPTKVDGFNEATDEFPCSIDVIELIKNSVFEKDFRVQLNATEDNQNSSNDEF